MEARSGIAARDRLWLDARSVLVLDGLDVPSPEAIRAALRRWAAVSPDHPVFRLLSPDGTGWRRLDGAALAEHCDAMVVPLADADVVDPDDLATTLYGRPPGIPLQFAAGRRLVGFSLEHAMFDAWGAHRVFAAVLRAAVTGTVPEDFLDGSTRTPLLGALARAGRQDPRTLARTVRGPRPSPPPGAADRTGDRTGEVVSWSPAPRLVSARSGPDTLGALRAWRRGAPRGVTVQALLFAAARIALEDAGLAPRFPGLYTLVDNRRYLDPDTRVAGNFSIPIYLDPADPTDPTAIAASLTAQLDAGVPLVTTAAWLAHAARERMSRHRGAGDASGQPPGGPVDRPRQPAPVLILNHLGRMRLLDPLPWRAGSADARYSVLATQGGPEDLTIYLTELRNRLNVCIGFHDTVFDTDRVRSVAEALAEDPVGLVTRQPVRQR